MKTHQRGVIPKRREKLCKQIDNAIANKNIFDEFLAISDNNEEETAKKVRDYVKKMMGRLVFKREKEYEFLKNMVGMSSCYRHLAKCLF